MTAAQSAYADVQKTIAQGPGRFGRPPVGGPQGRPRTAVGPSDNASAAGAKSSASSETSNSSTTYDKKDANKDGTVSALEEISYASAHPTVDASRESAATFRDKLNITA